MLFKIKKIESPLCYLCGKEPKTLEHLLFYCPRVQMIGNYITLTVDLLISKMFYLAWKVKNIIIS